jgi:hypothetical protein
MASDSGKAQLADKSGEFITTINRLPVDGNVQIGSVNADVTNPVPVSLQLGVNPVANTIPIPVSLQIGTNIISGTTPLPVALQIGNTQVATGNPVPVSDQGSSNIFYSNGTASSTSFTPAVAFGFTSKKVMIKNDGTQDITFSFDGATAHGLLKNADPMIQFDNKQNTQIFFRATTVGSTYRIWAW